MVQVSVGKDHRVDLAAFEFRLAPVFCALLFSALKEAAINQNARLVCNHVIRRSRYVTCCAMKMNFHRGSSLERPLPLANVRPVDPKSVCILTAGNLHVSKLFLRMRAD